MRAGTYVDMRSGSLEAEFSRTHYKKVPFVQHAERRTEGFFMLSLFMLPLFMFPIEGLALASSSEGRGYLGQEQAVFV